ncbi:hypothetical protein FB451DRAFT_1412194 [Mycena latifolia]|nr:hypothetical protein FB451DRAFT_1412194 [Mycena latifolia]
MTYRVLTVDPHPWNMVSSPGRSAKNPFFVLGSPTPPRPARGPIIFTEPLSSINVNAHLAVRNLQIAEVRVDRAQRDRQVNGRGSAPQLRRAEQRAKLSLAEQRVLLGRSDSLRAEPEILYLTATRPPEVESPKKHHLCGICRGVKSHPVSYECGHSHCYVCICLWLEESWKCPTCRKVMTAEPFRHYGEEDCLVDAYPDRGDKSEVDYSWDGLRFPKRTRVVEVTDSDSDSA